MSDGLGPRPDDTLGWAPPRQGVQVERASAGVVFGHGAVAGLVAGLVLGVVEMIASTVLEGDPWLPFDFAVAVVVGPEALEAGFPVAASVTLGTVIHLVLSMFWGVAFLAGVALTFQLSARAPLMVLYGVLFGVTVWEIDFLAVLPVVAPELAGRLDVATQLVNGIISYALVYGPVLAGYVVRVRPGLLDRWWQNDGEVA